MMMLFTTFGGAAHGCGGKLAEVGERFIYSKSGDFLGKNYG